MNEKQKLFPKVWRTLKYKTELDKHIVLILFLWDIPGFFSMQLREATLIG